MVVVLCKNYCRKLRRTCFQKGDNKNLWLVFSHALVLSLMTYCVSTLYSVFMLVHIYIHTHIGSKEGGR